ncbi:MAG: hypothetical protein P1V35_14255 [Planctomycetota bacterium]|nr:hypothetical protein [Planctomycetota bacterium]
MEKSPPSEIQNALSSLRSRWLRVNASGFSIQVLFYGAMALPLVLLFWPKAHLATCVAALVAGSLVVGYLLAFLRVPDKESLAKASDDHYGLKDRLTSALNLNAQDGAMDHGMAKALMNQSAESAREMQAPAVYPFALPSEGRWLVLPTLLVAALFFLRSPAEGNDELADNTADVVAEGLHSLEHLISQQKKQELQKPDKDLLQQLQEFQDRLKEQKTDKKDALAEIAKFSDDLDRQKEQKERELKDLERQLKGLGKKNPSMASEMERAAWQDALTKVREQIAELEEQLKNKANMSPEELAKLEEQLAKLKEIEAKLMKLMQLKGDLEFSGEIMDFLAAFEGELGELTEGKKAQMLKPCDCEDAST